MNRVQALSKEKAPEAVKPLFSALEAKLGRLPNIFLCMGNSPQALQGFMQFADLCEKTSLPAPLKTELALAVAESNQCNYCLSAHSAIAKAAGIAEPDILAARKAQARNPKHQAMLQFARAIVEKRGNVSSQEVQALKQQGVSDQEVVELLMCVALNMYTNYFNKVVDTEVDFPKAQPLNDAT